MYNIKIIYYIYLLIKLNRYKVIIISLDKIAQLSESNQIIRVIIIVVFIVELIAKKRKCKKNLAFYKTLSRLLLKETMRK